MTTLGVCLVCQLLDEDTTPKPVAWCALCRANLCERCAGDYLRRFRAMVRRAAADA